MATRYYLDGAEVVGKIRNAGDNAPGGGLAGLTSSAQGGNFGSGGVVIDDIAGALNVVGWRPFYVEEDEATPSRIFTGFVGGRAISQSDIFEAPGTARVWDCDLMDLNVILGLKLFRTAAANRGAETDLARIAWMLANWPAPDWPVFDNGGVPAINERNFDGADLRNQFPEEVLANLAIDVRQFFLYWDETASAGQEISLWYNYPTSVRGTSTVKLSNLKSDVNSTTVFAALNGQSVGRDPAFTYSGLSFKYRNGSFYQDNATTAATYIDRDMVYETDRIGLLSTASARATQILDRASTEKDTVTCTVILLNADVNKIKEGYRIEAKFTHLPGYTAYTLITIQKRTLRRPENGATDRWEVDLELSNDAPGSGGGEGGGDPGDFPLPPQATAPSLTTCVVAPGTGISAGSTGTELWPTEQYRGTLFGAASIVITSFTVTGYSAANYCTLRIAYSWNGGTIDYAPVLAQYGAGPGSTGQICWNAGGISQCSGYSSGTPYPSYPTILIDPIPGTGVGAVLRIWGVQGSQNDSVGDVTFCVTIGAVSDSAAGVVANEVVAPDPQPPEPGQVAPWTVVTMAGAVGTTEWPYAAGSLLVKVDGLLISRASYTETDPAAGTFTLSWAPDSDEVVTVQYQGI